MIEDWPIWRLVCERVASFEEVATYWDLEEVLIANEVLDLKEEAGRRADQAIADVLGK